MAIIDSNGIKSEGGTIKSQTIKVDRVTQTINRPVNNRVKSASSLSNNNGLNRNNLSRSNKLKNNRNVAKTAGRNEKNDLNPLKKAEQKRKPLSQRVPRQTVNSSDSDSLDNSNDNQDNQNPRDGLDGERNALQKPENELEEQNSQDNQSPPPASPEDENEDDDSTEKGSGLGKKIWNFLKKHPMVILAIFVALLLIFIILVLVAYFSSMFVGVSSNNEEMKKNYGPFFAFSNAEIALLDPSGTIPVSRGMILDEYVKGIVYADTMNLNFSSMTPEQISNFYKALAVSRKAQVLSKGKYNNKTKNMTLTLTDFNYCDPQYGCKMATKSGRTFYLSNDLELTVDRTTTEYEPLKTDLLSLLNGAVAETMSEVVVPTSVNEPLTTYNWSAPSVNNSTITSFLSSSRAGTKYDDTVKNVLSGYKVYNLDNYVSQYESVFLSLYSFWWPIGSDAPDATGSYSGDPASTNIISKYGPSFSTQTINKGMKISGFCNATKVIAPKDGRVSFVGTDERYGTYVIINHEDNVRTLLGSLAPGSVKVSVNQDVMQGDLIGLVGSIENSSMNCYLYVEMYVNGRNVDPLEYFSNDHPRPTYAKFIKFVQGNNNQQTVCKTLLASGFSKQAVAGLMANIENESGFKLDNLSDGGTSNGLFQWHKGRLSNLQNYCGAEYLTSIKCQLDFFLYEITEGSEKDDGAYDYLMGNHSAYDMGYQFCMLFERPAGGARSAGERGTLAENKYMNYVNNGCN